MLVRKALTYGLCTMILIAGMSLSLFAQQQTDRALAGDLDPRHLYAKALETMKTAAKYHPDSIYLELGLGLAQVLGDNPPRAIATCRRILAKEPNFGAARLLLAVAFYMNGENQNCAAETPGSPPVRRVSVPVLLTRGLAAEAELQRVRGHAA